MGWLVGLAAAAVVLACNYALATHPMLPWMAAVLRTCGHVAITGGFHEDGLADVADGLGGHLPAERALEVMKDSRLGSYGVMALCMGLLTKVVCVALLVQSKWPLRRCCCAACTCLARRAPGADARAAACQQAGGLRKPCTLRAHH